MRVELKAENTKGRIAGLPSVITINVDEDDDGTITHRVRPQFVSEPARKLADQILELDLDLPSDAGYHRVAQEARKEGLTGSTSLFRDAVKFNKGRGLWGRSGEDAEESQEFEEPEPEFCPECSFGDRRHSIGCSRRRAA